MFEDGNEEWIQAYLGKQSLGRTWSSGCRALWSIITLRECLCGILGA